MSPSTLIRALAEAPVLREAGEADEHLATVDIRFARFNQWNEIDSWWEGRFLERLAPGAFRKTFAERGDKMKVLYDHGRDPSIGRKVLGRHYDLRETTEGPEFSLDLFRTSYGSDLLPGLRAGLYGASYRFRPIQETWNEEPGRSEHNPDGIPERTLVEVACSEAGPVTFPADDETDVSVRSLTDQLNPPPEGHSPGHYAEGAVLGRARGREDRTPADADSVAEAERARRARVLSLLAR